VSNPDIAAIEALGWSVEATTDLRGHPYWRATWREYTRGGYSPAKMRDCVESTLEAIEAREQRRRVIVQLPLFSMEHAA
jgi:hypothetical protein